MSGKLGEEYASAGDADDERRYSPAACTSITKRRIEGDPDLCKANTSYTERHNLSIRMGMSRFTRLTNSFSKKAEKRVAMVHLYTVHFNFCRVHTHEPSGYASDGGRTVGHGALSNGLWT